MVVSRKVISQKSIIIRYIFAFIFLLVGFLFNFLNIGMTPFFNYGTVGSYLIFCGLLFIFVTTIMIFSKKDKIIDERNEKIGYKAMNWVWYTICIGGFIIMIIDGIFKINLSISYFVSYSICLLLIIYFIAYKFYNKKI